MGKYVAKMMIILTGIIVLAHSAIPHHHHQGQVCIETEDVKCCTFPDNPISSDHNHEHDANNNYTRCFVSEFVPVSSKSIYRLNNSEYAYDKHFPDFSGFIFSENSRISTFLSQSLIPETDYQLFYSSAVHFSSGLRAPPVV